MVEPARASGTVGTRPAAIDSGEGGLGRLRPVVLATLGVPLDDRAAVLAVDTAVELRARLIVANVVALEPLLCTIMLGYEDLETPETTESLRRPVELAHDLGISVELLRVMSLRPVEALLQLVNERGPSLLVFGPRARTRRGRRARRALARIRETVTCAVWYPGELDGPAGPGRWTPTS